MFEIVCQLGENICIHMYAHTQIQSLDQYFEKYPIALKKNTEISHKENEQFSFYKHIYTKILSWELNYWEHP